MSKKLIAILLTLVMLLSFAACGNEAVQTPTDEPTVPTTTEGVNPLIGHQLVTFGTSITYGQGAATCYGKLIADRNEMVHTNFAVGGNSAIKTYGVYTIQKNLAPLKDLTADDYVIFEGLFNNYSLAKGALSPEGTTLFDTNTVYGALEQTIYDYKQSGCPAKVGYILTHYGQDTSDPENYGPIWQIAVDVCEKYDIPLLDLRYKPYELNSDKVHLTTAGQQAMADDVEAWLKTLK